MKRLTTIVLLIIWILSLGADCDSRQTACKSYQGDPNATEPYDAPPVVTVTHDGFDTIMARVGLHNPTGVEYEVDVECTFWVGGMHDDENPGQHTASVCPDSSVYVEIQYGTDLLQSTEVGATCTAVWNQKQ